MSSNIYTLISPVTITKRTPGRDGAPDKVETRTVTDFKRKAIGAGTYFQHGDVNFVAQAPGGTSFEVELDEVIETYIRHQIDDPDAPAIFDAVKLPDAMALRQDLLDLFADATAAARGARAGADPERVTLTRSFTYHDEVVRELRLEEPRHRDFARYGRPFTWSRTPDGAVQPMERMSVIKQYIERTLQHEIGADVLPLLNLTDGMQLKRAVLGFFTRAAVTVNGVRSSTPSFSMDVSAHSTPATP